MLRLQTDEFQSRQKAEERYKELHKCYDDIEVAELKSTPQLSSIPELKKVNDAVSAAIGKDSFNSWCRPHFVAISKDILTKLGGQVVEAPAATELTVQESAGNQV